MNDFTKESALLVKMILVFPPLPLSIILNKQHQYRSITDVMNFVLVLQSWTIYTKSFCREIHRSNKSASENYPIQIPSI